jgi:hypothetical protein
VRRRLLIAAVAALPLAARAQDEPPLAFLQGLYEPYRKPDFKGLPYWEARRFFVPDLAQAIERDFEQAKKRNEVPILDGDPFIDAQDWSIPYFGYAVSGGPVSGYAAAVVTFTNSGKPKQLALFLVYTPPHGWRIDDIVSRGSSLRALYKLR